MYVTSKEMLEKARLGGYAVGAFNVENMEMAMAIIETAEEMKAPVMLQTTPSTVKYAGCGMYAAMVKVLAEKATVPVCLHLDHGSSPELAFDALRCGYSSVMMDGSKETLEGNIAVTNKVIAVAHALNIPVEAELGKVGGKEDDLSAENQYTDPYDALRFVTETGVDSLAVAIGTAHGIYKGTPVLDVNRLGEIRDLLEKEGKILPLVLHGASGLSEKAVRDCIAKGICKVNFATELRQAYTEGVRETLNADAEVFDPKKYGKTAMAKVKDIVRGRILVCGSDGKAN